MVFVAIVNGVYFPIGYCCWREMLQIFLLYLAILFNALVLICRFWLFFSIDVLIFFWFLSLPPFSHPSLSFFFFLFSFLIALARTFTIMLRDSSDIGHLISVLNFMEGVWSFLILSNIRNIRMLVSFYLAIIEYYHLKYVFEGRMLSIPVDQRNAF